MDRERALDRLAGEYARALRLADDGLSPADIAVELGIDQAAVPSLLRIGTAKLAHLMGEGTESAVDPTGTDAGAADDPG